MLAAVLMLPGAALSINIGEIVLQSRLGEPLHAQVELTAESGEHVENSCLSLTAPTVQEGNARDYLTRAKLAIKTSAGRQYVDISTKDPFNEPFANLRLQVKCPGAGIVIKTLAILPDLPDLKEPSVIAAPGVPPEKESRTQPPLPSEAKAPAAIAAPVTLDTPPEKTAPQASAQQSVTPLTEAMPRVETLPTTTPPQSSAKKSATTKAARPAKKQQVQPVPAARKKPAGAASFRLKLSSAPIDETRIEKTSAKERASLRERQKILDADDQTAQFLALQHLQNKLDVLGGIKLKIAQVDTIPVIAAASSVAAPVVAVAASAPAPAQESHPKPAASKPAMALNKPPAPQSGLLDIAFIAAGLVVVALALVLGLRYYSRIKSQRAAGSILQQPSKVRSNTPAPSYTLQPVAPPPVERHVATTPAPAFVQPQAISTPAPAPEPKPEPQPEPKKEMSELDLVMEEAELYAIHGHPNKAVDILKEVIEQNPAKAEAWLLLLSIYSSVGKAQEFEQTAQGFLKLNPDSPSWKSIQALGRTLDHDNPLYGGNDSSTDAALSMQTIGSRRPIGDILVEMGALSVQDMKNCLADFDPKVHGRFGGYLISRKVITHAQLDEALLRQQGIHPAAAPSDAPAMPSLEEKPLDFEFESPTDKTQIMDLNFEPPAPQANNLDFDLSLGSPKAINSETQPANTPAPEKANNLDFDLSLGNPKATDFATQSTDTPVPEKANDIDFDLSLGNLKAITSETQPADTPTPEIELHLDMDLTDSTPQDKKPAAE